MKYWVVDASVWVARLVAQDAFFTPVKTWIEERRYEGDILLSPALLLAEMAGAISRRTSDIGLAQRAVEIVQNLSGVRLVEMDRKLIQSAAQVAANLGLRGADSIYVAVAVQLKVPLVTLDKEQNERAKQIVPVHMLAAKF